MRASELRISSDRPSEKNTLSLSSDRFSNGSTAMDLAGMAVTADAGTELLVAVVVDANSGAPCAAGIAEVAVTPWLVGAPATFHKNPPPTASTSATSSNSVPLARCRPWSPWYQASNSVTKKPTQIAMINRRSTESGQPKRCATTSSTWISANENATYAIAHCTSLRCFRRAKNPVGISFTTTSPLRREPGAELQTGVSGARSLADKCLRAGRRRRFAQVRPAVTLPVIHHSDAPREALECRVSAGLARPRFRLPQPVEIAVRQTAVAMLEQIERASGFAQLQQHRRRPVVVQMRGESFQRSLVPCGVAISAAIDHLQIGDGNLRAHLARRSGKIPRRSSHVAMCRVVVFQHQRAECGLRHATAMDIRQRAGLVAFAPTQRALVKQ